ncbi:SpoIID/LytB domain protein [Chitinispirillum alkaliphilum]|nr:SpoIID/LytB domain protein [Chitinispirillum alkaliphilum]
MNNLRKLKTSFAVVFSLTFGCSTPFLVPNPPGGIAPDMPAEAFKTEVDSAEDFISEEEIIDFSVAFREDTPRDSQKISDSFEEEKTVSYRYPPIRVEKRPVRVMIRRHARSKTIYTPSRATIRYRGGSVAFRGRVHVQALGDGSRISATVDGETRQIPLPCTLSLSSLMQFVEVGEDSYRGNLILLSEGRNSFSVVNVVGVEDYLRGVVPREIGRLGEPEMAAMKSQAVAARTYVYVRMKANRTRDFDVLSTVADQVYGGANDEYRYTDMAIRLTKDLVMAYGDEIIHAYYHSTCGGQTANVHEVWAQHSPYPYLRSVSDLNSEGVAYCHFSRLFTWEESWNLRQLSTILTNHSRDGRLTTPYSGAFRSINVNQRFSCGRIKSASINSSGGNFLAGGDRIRFLLRRNNNQQGILFSSNFTVKESDRNRLVVAGRGFGHGVGMCQVGAIGRSRAGYTFDRILRAYYSGVQIRTAVE